MIANRLDSSDSFLLIAVLMVGAACAIEFLRPRLATGGACGELDDRRRRPVRVHDRVNVKLSVLDQSPIRSGGTAADALRETIELAQITERLGYHRYWVAEHHGSASFAGSSPEVLISTIAANTSRIRVGSGGVMLMHYSPLKVAENFRLLATLYPGSHRSGHRARAGKRRHHCARARLRVQDRDGVFSGEARRPEGVHQRPASIYRSIEPGARDAGARRLSPELWMLASSEDGARLAAHFGLPLSFAHFISARTRPSRVVRSIATRSGRRTSARCRA